MPTISPKWLRERRACYVDRYIEIFGEEPLRVTLSRLRKAARLGFDIGWLANELLTTAPALKAYDETVATALKAYDEATATARKAYDEALATALWSALRIELAGGGE